MTYSKGLKERNIKMKDQNNKMVEEFIDRKNELKKMINKNFGTFKLLAEIGEGANAEKDEKEIVLAILAMIKFMDELSDDMKLTECLIQLGFIHLLRECGAFNDNDEEEEDDEEEEETQVKIIKTNSKDFMKKLVKLFEEKEGENE